MAWERIAEDAPLKGGVLYRRTIVIEGLIPTWVVDPIYRAITSLQGFFQGLQVKSWNVSGNTITYTYMFPATARLFAISGGAIAAIVVGVLILLGLVVIKMILEQLTTTVGGGGIILIGLLLAGAAVYFLATKPEARRIAKRYVELPLEYAERRVKRYA